jgi:hypothetical protein
VSSEKDVTILSLERAFFLSFTELTDGTHDPLQRIRLRGDTI